MDKVAQSPAAAKTPSHGSGEPMTDEEAGGSRGRSGGSHRKKSGIVRGMKKLLSGGRKKGSKESSIDTASTCSSSSRRGEHSPRSPHHGGAHHSPHHRDSLEPVGQPHKVDEKELKKDHHELVAHPGPKKHGKKIPDAGETIAAYTVFENDNVKGNAQLAECHEKEGKLQVLGETPVKKKREKKESGKSGKSVEVTRKNSKQRGRTKESPGIKTAGARTPTTPKSPGKSMEPTRKKSTPNASTPRRGASRERLSREK